MLQCLFVRFSADTSSVKCSMWMIHILQTEECFYWRWTNLVKTDFGVGGGGVQDLVVERWGGVSWFFHHENCYQASLPPLTPLNWGSPAWAELPPGFQTGLCSSFSTFCLDYSHCPYPTHLWSLQRWLIMIGADAVVHSCRYQPLDCKCIGNASILTSSASCFPFQSLFRIKIMCSIWPVICHNCPIWSPHWLVMMVNWWHIAFMIQQRKPIVFSCCLLLCQLNRKKTSVLSVGMTPIAALCGLFSIKLTKIKVVIQYLKVVRIHVSEQAVFIKGST